MSQPSFTHDEGGRGRSTASPVATQHTRRENRAAAWRRQQHSSVTARTLPPGNSQSPAIARPGGRCARSTSPASLMRATAATSTVFTGGPATGAGICRGPRCGCEVQNDQSRPVSRDALPVIRSIVPRHHVSIQIRSWKSHTTLSRCSIQRCMLSTTPCCRGTLLRVTQTFIGPHRHCRRWLGASGRTVAHIRRYLGGRQRSRLCVLSMIIRPQPCRGVLRRRSLALLHGDRDLRRCRGRVPGMTHKIGTCDKQNMSGRIRQRTHVAGPARVRTWTEQTPLTLSRCRTCSSLAAKLGRTAGAAVGLGFACRAVARCQPVYRSRPAEVGYARKH